MPKKMMAVYTREYWDRLVRAYIINCTDDIATAVVDRLVENPASNIWHEAHIVGLGLREKTWKPCSLCGGLLPPDQGAHNLCVARKEHGLPIKRLDPGDECPCAKCRGTR